MANLDAQPIWTEVRQLETHELARGGLNGNMNEQAKALAARTNFLKRSMDQIKTPIDYEINDETADVSGKLAQLLDPSGKHVIQMTKGTYLIDSITIPPNTIVYGNGAIFKRRRHTDKPTVTVSENSVLFGAFVDGNKGVLGAGTLQCRGIDLRRNALAIFCHSYDNARHGFYAVNDDLMDFINPSVNQKTLFCKSYNNGFNPGGGGTGDGFSAMNSSNVLFFGCEAWNNARTGFVGTTYNRETTKNEPSFSKRVKANHCRAWGNGYSDFNFEGVSYPEVINIEGDSLTFSDSNNANIHNISEIGSIYAQNADFANVSGINIKNNIRSHSLFYLQGKAPKVNGINAIVGNDVTVFNYNAIEILDTETNSGDVSNISINKAYNGIILRVSNAVNIRVDQASNVYYRIFRPQGSVQFSNFKSLVGGKLEVYSSSIPIAGAWNKNDIVWNTFFSTTNKILCWVCTESGAFGENLTPPKFDAVTIFTKGSSVANATGTDNTAQQLNALISSLKSAGFIS